MPFALDLPQNLKTDPSYLIIILIAELGEVPVGDVPLELVND